MSTLRTVVYASTAAHLMSFEELEALLKEARDLNERDGITGVLLYNDGSFTQCIEGEEAAVLDTFARIVASRRHHSIFELLNEPIAGRSFPDWHMGFFGPPGVRSLSEGREHGEWQRLGEPGGVAWDSLAYNLMSSFRSSLRV